MIPTTPDATVAEIRIYIAGPMSGCPGLNRPAFWAAEERLQAAGWQVANPARNFPEQVDTRADNVEYRGYLLAGFRMLSTCDAIYLLCGWQGSKGALAEAQIAYAMDLRIYVEDGNRYHIKRDESRRPVREGSAARLADEGRGQ